MLPEVEEYFRAMNDGDGVYDRALNEAHTISVPRWNIAWDDAERATYYTTLETRQNVIQAAERENKERQAKAYHALNATEDKLVQFLLTDQDVRAYTHQRDEVLKNLPMDREQMEEFGNARGWCGTYEELLRRAEAAGVLPEPSPELADVTELAAAIRREYGGTTKTARRLLRKHLPALLESAKVKAAEAASQNDGVKVAETATA